MFIFTDKYYSMAFIRGEGKRPLIENGTKWADVPIDTLKNIYTRHTSNSGSYTLLKDSIKFHVHVAKDPGVIIRGDRTWRYVLKGNKLIFIWEGENEKGKWVGKRIWERVQ